MNALLHLFILRVLTYKMGAGQQYSPPQGAAVRLTMGNTIDVSLLSTGPHSEGPELTQRSRGRVWSTAQHMAGRGHVSATTRIVTPRSY